MKKDTRFKILYIFVGGLIISFMVVALPDLTKPGGHNEKIFELLTNAIETASEPQSAGAVALNSAGPALAERLEDSNTDPVIPVPSSLLASNICSIIQDDQIYFSKSDITSALGELGARSHPMTIYGNGRPLHYQIQVHLPVPESFSNSDYANFIMGIQQGLTNGPFAERTRAGISPIYENQSPPFVAGFPSATFNLWPFGLEAMVTVQRDERSLILQLIRRIPDGVKPVQ